MIQQSKRILYSIFHSICALTFLAIFLIIFFNKKTLGMKFLMILSTLTILLILFILYLFIQRYREKVDKIGNKQLFFIFIFFAVIQIVIGLNLKVTPSWDFGFVFDEAVKLTENHSWIVSNQSYFQMYPNNQLYLLTLTCVFKLLSLFHFTNFVTAGILINLLFVDISLYILFICMKKIWNKRIALFGLLLSFICCAYTMYLPIFYTDTFPLPFTNIMLLLYIILLKEKDVKKMMLYLVLLGVSCMIGFEYKATVIIILIAVILHMIFCLHPKKAMIFTSIICIVFLGTTKLYTYNVQNAGVFDITLYDRYNFPYTHWVMMGLKGSGGYSGNDYRYTRSFTSKEEKTDANILEIKNRVENMGAIGFAKHLVKKINYTWEDGTYFSTKLLSRKPLTNGVIRNIFAEGGSYVNVFKSCANAMHYAILILMILSACNGIYRMKNIKQMDFISCLRLSIYGLFVFLLIWESKSKYLVNFLPIIYIVAIDGMNYLYVLLNKIRRV